jgi:hypothetical protein
MAIDWNLFEYSLTTYFRQKKSKSEEDTAYYLTNLYDANIRCGSTQYQNKVISANKEILKNMFFAGLIDARRNKLNNISNKFSSGLILYWNSVTLDNIVPPPTATITVTNIILSSGLSGKIKIYNTYDFSSLSRSLIFFFRNHLMTIKGISKSIITTPSGPILIDFPWIGYQ